MDHRKRVASHKLAFSKALADKAKAESEGRGSAGIGEGVLGVSEDDLEADLKTQLEVYDAKVYRAQLQMVKEFTLQLRSMGVPFFGTRMEYVVLPDKSAEGTPVEGGEKKPEEIQKVDGKVTEKELVELQRKMLELLESLCDAK